MCSKTATFLRALNLEAKSFLAYKAAGVQREFIVDDNRAEIHRSQCVVPQTKSTIGDVQQVEEEQTRHVVEPSKNELHRKPFLPTDSAQVAMLFLA